MSLKELVKFLLPLREKLVISLLNMNVLITLHFCIWMRVENGVQDVFRLNIKRYVVLRFFEY